MTQYEVLLEKKFFCRDMAERFIDDTKMHSFWLKMRNYYSGVISSLTIAEAEVQV